MNPIRPTISAAIRPAARGGAPNGPRPGGGGQAGAGDAMPGVDAVYLGDALLEALGHRPHPRLYPYFLGVNRLGTAAIPANATISDQAPVGGDAAFLAAGLIGQQSAGDFLLTLKWSHLSGTTFSQVGLHSRALFGTDFHAFPFTRPQLMPHDSTLTVEITNLAAVTNAVSVFVYGYKVLR